MVGVLLEFSICLFFVFLMLLMFEYAVLMIKLFYTCTTILYIHTHYPVFYELSGSVNGEQFYSCSVVCNLSYYT